MDRLLRPGMRLMRRFTVTGKFVAIALVLLVPTSILTGGSVNSAVAGVRATSAERDGGRLVQPLTLLVIRLAGMRIAAAAGTRRGELRDLVDRIDRVQAEHGDTFATSSAWSRVRAEVMALPTGVLPPSAPVPDEPALTSAAAGGAVPGTTPGSPAALATATADAVALLNRAADNSHLVLDPALDSYYVTISLVDRVPALLDAAASAAEHTPTTSPRSTSSSSSSTTSVPTTVPTTVPTSVPTAGDASASRLLAQPARRLTADLLTAVAGTHWNGLDAQIRPSFKALNSALTGYAQALGQGRGGLRPTTDGLTAGERLTDAAADLVGALGDGLDHLLSDRQYSLARHAAGPFAAALLALVVAVYLFAALARATSRDARQILADIDAVTTGALHQTRPLDGSDEFAQMSSAVVVARDQLTSLLGTLRFQATHDELTALGNRSLFTQKLGEALGDSDPRVAVVVVGMDGFQDVNDSFGHAIGDRLLRALGARFHRATRRRDVVARLGPDQFGVLLTDAGDERTTAAAVESLVAALEQPVDVDGRRLRVRASVGVTTPPLGGTTATEMLRNADVAMHAAKDMSGTRIAFFEPAMHEATRERTELSIELVQAVEQGQLSVVYQPIVDLFTETIHGVEALVRWEHPTRGPVSPTIFVPLAEATGMIVPIGRWVMREAVGQLAAWREEFPDSHPLTMDVNLSPDQLGDPDLVGDVLSLLSDTGVDPASIVLEITESALVGDVRTAMKRLGQLSAMGLRLALDDFGTGYSSLSYLRKLPVTVLKIDKSFVTDSDTSTTDPGHTGATLLSGIVQLGTGLGMQIVAEGIENMPQVERLRAAGCHLGQGYLWSRPLPADDVREVLRRRGRMPAGLPRPRPA